MDRSSTMSCAWPLTLEAESWPKHTQYRIEWGLMVLQLHITVCSRLSNVGNLPIQDVVRLSHSLHLVFHSTFIVSHH